MFVPKNLIIEKFLEFLKEDVGQGDITTGYTIPTNVKVEAEIVAKEAGIVAGIEEAAVILDYFNFQTDKTISDGSQATAKTVIMRIFGDARTLLSIERTLLNLISRMSGIATITRFTKTKLQKAGFKTRIASTRKIAPGLLYFDKKAVEVGGGDTHRLHLDDLILIKDNHLAIAGTIEKVLRKVKEPASFSKKIEIEVTTTENALTAAQNGANIILLDNFSTKNIERTMKFLEKKKLRQKVLVEASGGVTHNNVLKYAATGVDIVSLGEITDSIKSLDVSLEVKKLVKH